MKVWNEVLGYQRCRHVMVGELLIELHCIIWVFDSFVKIKINVGKYT